ncbi:hypothetical protein [Rubrivirga sp. IMCC43871]|uniref:hypothetical protein n=1 Tax=Rubrivirga sp. IMCC43871 TaxID=3391575 RepID=UPI00399001C1
MTLPQDFLECAELFVAHDVRFMVVGGHAVMAHGYPRSTDDFDLWVEPTPDNGDRVVRALGAFGFQSLGLQREDFAAEDVIIQLGRAPRRIDVITSITGATFEACYPRRVLVEVDGLRLPVIGRECLIANKRATGRLKDLADVEGLGEPPSDE